MAIDASALVVGVSADEQIQTLARRLAAIHGQVVLRREASGLHAYMACPRCLEAYGRRELSSKHLAVNLEKHLKLGEYADSMLPHERDGKTRTSKGRKKTKGCAACMKEHGSFDMHNLLEGWKPLSERVENSSPSMVVDSGKSRYLVPNERGVMVPDGPGATTSLLALPTTHPAIQYLLYREYDPVLLHNQFNATWCYREAPEGEIYNRWYRKHAGEWKSTPQGRIIFESRVHGNRVCWQGRYLEIKNGDTSLVWHPYRERWEPRPAWGKNEDPMKYNTGTACLRNAQLCGYDYVVACSKARQETDPCCVLTEGPLDAARFPDRGMAVLGKFLSEAQVTLIRLHFSRVVLAFDADAPGREAYEKASAVLNASGIRTANFFSDQDYRANQKTDVGQLGYAACADRLNILINTF